MSLETVQSQPAVPVASVPDFNAFTAEELQGALASGSLDNLTPPVVTESSTSAPAVAVVEPTGADQTAAAPAEVLPTPATPTSEAADDTSETPAAADPAEVAPEVPIFEFTADADDETFAKEKALWAEQYEVDPATQFLLDRQERQLTQLREQVETAKSEEILPLYTKAVEALDALATRVTDPRNNQPVPNTAPLVEFLKTSYPQELPELAESLLSLPSPKYQGITLFQEYLRDFGNLDEQGLITVQQVLENGGRLPTPSFVPQGIDSAVAEAFWQSPNRQAIMEQVEAHYEILGDPLATQEDKTASRNYIYQVNQSLSQVQYGLDARVKAQQQVQQQQYQSRQQVMQAGDQAYAETSAALTRSFSERLAANLDMFDAPAARVTALAYGNLIVNALAGDDWSAHAQADLAKEGITFNWTEGQKALERLRNAEHNIAGHVATKASPAAVEIAKKEKAAAIKDVKRLELDLMGRISKVAVLGASKVLESKAATAPKTPAARPRTTAAAAGSSNGVPTTENSLAAYDTMTPEELQSRIGQLRAEHGIGL